MSRDHPFALLLNALTPSIALRISPERFEFWSLGQVEPLAPIIYLTGSGRNQVVAGVGDAMAPAGPHLRVALLDPLSEPAPPLTRIDALEAFIRYGIAKVLNRRVLIRPSVAIHGVESIGGTFAGRELQVFREVLIRAGAHRVSFSNRPT